MGPAETSDRLADEFRATRDADAGDLALAKRIRTEMGRVYALRLTPQDRKAFTGLVREFKQWARDQEPMTPADKSLKELRRVLRDLGSRSAAVTTVEIAAALGEADRIRRGLDGPLPEAVTAGLRRWRGNLQYRRGRRTARDFPALLTLAAPLISTRPTPW